MEMRAADPTVALAVKVTLVVVPSIVATISAFPTLLPKVVLTEATPLLLDWLLEALRVALPEPTDQLIFASDTATSLSEVTVTVRASDNVVPTAAVCASPEVFEILLAVATTVLVPEVVVAVVVEVELVEVDVEGFVDESDVVALEPEVFFAMTSQPLQVAVATSVVTKNPNLLERLD